MTASARSKRLLLMNSSKRPSSIGVSVRVATLKMSAPCDLAWYTLAAKVRTLGVDLKLWNEMIRRTFFFLANLRSDRSAEAERNSSRYNRRDLKIWRADPVVGAAAISGRRLRADAAL